MPIIEIVFYVFSLILTGAAVMVITVRNPVYAALFLVLAFVSSAAIWMLLEAEFLSIVLVLVYVGAVMVLFLFVVMMLDVNLAPLQEGFIRYLPVGLLILALMAMEFMLVIWASDSFDAAAFPVPSPNPEGFSNTKAVGELLYTQYLLPFEVAGLILLVAIIAAIALTLRHHRPGTKTQNPSRQVLVRREERIRLAKMKSETRLDKRG